MKKLLSASFMTLLVFACTPYQQYKNEPDPPQWSTDKATLTDHEYDQYLTQGHSTISGQAFLTQRGGGVVKAAGRTVTLDPATTLGKDWWSKAGTVWEYHNTTPPSHKFLEARKTTTADADGRFEFNNLPAGQYYVRTEVTWDVPGYYYVPMQGGLVGQMVHLSEDESVNVILNQYAK